MIINEIEMLVTFLLLSVMIVSNGFMDILGTNHPKNIEFENINDVAKSFVIYDVCKLFWTHIVSNINRPFHLKLNSFFIPH